MKDIGSCTSKLWDEVCLRVKHAAVFIDNNTAECLHWNGGLVRLLDAGAVQVKEFSPFERTDIAKIVFIVSTPLIGTAADVIKAIICASPCQYAVAITTVNLLTHVFMKHGSLVGETSDVIEHIEENLLEWMGNTSYTAEVLQIPLSCAEICQDFFVMPAFTELHPLIDSDLRNINLSSKSAKKERSAAERLCDITLQTLPHNLRSFYQSVIAAIHDLLEELEVREEIYSLGRTSHMLAQELENFPQARYRRKNCQSPVSLVFIDRTLDLCSATSQTCDSLLDVVVHALPRLPGHRNDVTIDLSSLSSARNVSGETIAPGCLADIHNSSTLQSLLCGKQKETLMNLHRELVDAATKEKLSVKLTSKMGRSGYEQLSHTAAVFVQNNHAVANHAGILQASLAISQAMNHPGTSCHKNRASTEKLLLQGMGDDSQSTLTHLADVFTAEINKPRNERSYTLDDLLTLLVHVYSMLGHSVIHRHDDERVLQDLFIDAILRESPDLPPITKDLVGDASSRHRVSVVVAEVWVKLRSMSRARQHLKQFGCLVQPHSDTAPTSFTPLLKQLFRTILDPSKPELIDLDYHSSALKDFLKSGFGLFKSASKPRPDASPACIVFVVGGVTASEVKMIREVVVASKSPTRVVVGSTQLIAPADVTRRLLLHDHLNPRISGTMQ